MARLAQTAWMGSSVPTDCRDSLDNRDAKTALLSATLAINLKEVLAGQARVAALEVMVELPARAPIQDFKARPVPAERSAGLAD